VSESWRGAPEEEAVRKMLEDAGPRPAVPEVDLRAIREAARAEWSRRYGTGSKRGRPFRPWLPLAAAVLAAAVGIAWWVRSRPAPIAATVATVQRVTGSAKWKTGSTLTAGSELDTSGDAAGRLTLRMRGGASVRLDAATQVRLASATMVELRRGAVYVDTGVAPQRSEDVAVRAGSALFRPAGTQFQVRVGGKDSKLQVREGRVAMVRGNGSVVAAAGEEIVVSGDGRIVRRSSAVSGPDWEWVAFAAPIPPIEGVKLRDFLDWYTHETGRRFDFADSEAAVVAGSCVLHGSIENVGLTDAPGIVLSSCGLDRRVSDGALVVIAPGKKDRRAR
jgi:ferric-dicitrate binding protein FerR (iron transport regulator)